jgi:alpha-L-rhamnosidase
MVTDKTWKYEYDPGPIMSDKNYAGEEYDGRYDCEGWNRADYNDNKWEFAAIHSSSN